MWKSGGYCGQEEARDGSETGRQVRQFPGVWAEKIGHGLKWGIRINCKAIFT